MTFPTFFFSCICFIASATWKPKEPGKTPTHCRVDPFPSWAPQHLQTSLRHSWGSFSGSSSKSQTFRCLCTGVLWTDLGSYPRRPIGNYPQEFTQPSLNTHKDALLTQMRKCSVCHHSFLSKGRNPDTCQEDKTSTKQYIHRTVSLLSLFLSAWARPGFKAFLKPLHQTSSQVWTLTDHH